MALMKVLEEKVAWLADCLEFLTVGLMVAGWVIAKVERKAAHLECVSVGRMVFV